MKEQYRVMVARFPGNNSEHPASSEYAANLRLRLRDDPRVESADSWYLADTPITMTRNRCVQDAIKAGIDILVMIDSDMAPDIIGHAEKAFWPDAFDFIRSRWNHCPTIVGAPYVGPRPSENIYVFRWRTKLSDSLDPHFSLEQYTREEAAIRSGVEEVAALPTGLVAIDMRLFTGFKHLVTGETVKMKSPYFYYEWKDETQSDKASTEDVTFTRDANLLFRAAGIGHVCYCNWDSWAIHMKLTPCMRPKVISSESVSEQLRNVVLQGEKAGNSRLQFMGEGLPKMPAPQTPCPASRDKIEPNGWKNRLAPGQNGIPLVPLER